MALDFSKGTPLNQEDNISIIKPENNQVTTQNDNIIIKLFNFFELGNFPK